MKKPKTVKEQMVNLIKEKGYPSINQFCKTCNIDMPNFLTNITGKYKLSIARAFVLADNLGMPVTEILEIFYPEEMKANSVAVRKFKVPVAK